MKVMKMKMKNEETPNKNYYSLLKRKVLTYVDNHWGITSFLLSLIVSALFLKIFHYFIAR